MDKQVKVVIGANYGDECKGLVSYCLAKEANAQGRKILTVLFNGGAQRAHTADGKIFHCTGTGAAVGSDTYYDQKFMVDPVALWLDKAKVYINPYCRVVLPCDITNNQQRELRLRNSSSGHGTCGMGIFEACKRSKIEKYCVYAKELFMGWRQLYDKLIEIEKEYGYPRDLVYNNDNFMRAVKYVTDKCSICDLDELKYKYDTIIFEGGQGLMLDQDNTGDFPYLTPSSTGVQNITQRLLDLEVNPELYYVSRSYLTRHGKGPLPRECEKSDINPEIVDETNKPNPWQEEIRYGFLDNEAMLKRVWKNACPIGGAKINLVYTHLNYTNDKLAVGRNSFETIKKPSFVNHVYGSDSKDAMGVIL